MAISNNTNKLLSGKEKQTLADGNYRFVSLSETEKYIGIPPGNNYVLVSDSLGNRSWQLSAAELPWTTISSNTYANTFGRYLTNSQANSFVIYLPNIVSDGDYIQITDTGHLSNNNVTVNRNGLTIENQNLDLILDVSDTFIELFYSENTWQFITNLGKQGVQGATGFQGIQGTIGIQGAQGFQGAVGVQGNQGNQGSQGDTGVQGIQGIQGFQGTQGFQGVVGVQCDWEIS